MKVKTTILAPLFLWIGFFPVYADESMAESIIVQQQVKGIRISGTVLDKEKSPLPGVNVTVKNEPGGAITDVDGHFYIEVPNKQSVLNITYIGFKSKEIVVGNEINFNIILEEDVEALDEVVVVGYGNQKKLSVIGSVQTIEPTKLQVGSSRSLSNNLAGQLAGVIAERSLNDLDPAEIESFSVLKDASASAMYGVRGANGVIIINTKRGTIAAPSVNVRVEQSIQAPTKLPEFIGAAEYMSLLNSLESDPNKRMFTKEQILKTYYGYDKDLYPNVD